MDKNVGKLIMISDSNNEKHVLRILRKDGKGMFVKHAGQRVPVIHLRFWGKDPIYWAPLKDAEKQRKKRRTAER